MISDPKAKAEILSQFFDEKHCKDKISVPLSCHPEPKLMSIAFRSRDLCKILADLDEYGGTDPHGISPMFLRKTCKEMSPELAVVFRLLIRRGSFPWCWRKADVVPVPKEPSNAMIRRKRNSVLGEQINIVTVNSFLEILKTHSVKNIPRQRIQ